MPHLSMSPAHREPLIFRPTTPRLTYPTPPNSFPSPCRLSPRPSSNPLFCSSPHVPCLSFHSFLHPYPAPKPVSFSSSRPNQAQYQRDPVPVFLPLSHTSHASCPCVPKILNF